jgi:hypothetical protein
MTEEFCEVVAAIDKLPGNKVKFYEWVGQRNSSV